MGFLCAFRLVLKLSRRRTQKVCSVQIINPASCCIHCFAAETHAVGTHVGNVAGFVQALRGSHRVACRHPQFAVGLLLHRTGRERRRRSSCLIFLFDLFDGPRTGRDTCLQIFCSSLFEQQNGCAVLELTGILIEVFTGRDSAAGNSLQHRFKPGITGCIEGRFQVPERAAAKFQTFDFAINQHSHGNTLHSAGR